MNNREQWVDSARGYALAMVVFGHLGVPVIGKYFTSFHMALFFFLSGFTFRATQPYKVFLKKKTKRLLIPYIFLGIPLIFAACITRYLSGVKDIGEYGQVLLKFIVQERFGTIWFLTCLFLLMQLFYLIVRLARNNYLIIGGMSVVLAILGLLYYRLVAPGGRFPWNADVCLTAAPFFAAGYICSQHRKKIETALETTPKWILFVVSAVVYFVAVTLNIKVSGQVLNFATNEYGCIPLTVLSVVCGSICTIMISIYLPCKIPAYLGKHTMVYFAWHQAIVLPIILFAYEKLGLFQQNTLASDGIRTAVTFVLLFVVLLPFDLLFRKTKLRFCIGE